MPSLKRTNCLRFAGGLELQALHCTRCMQRWVQTSAEEQRQSERDYDEHCSGFRVDPYFNAVVSDELSQRLAAIVPPPDSLHDVGCGNGEFSTLVASAGYAAHGVDVSEVALRSSVPQGVPGRLQYRRLVRLADGAERTAARVGVRADG